MAENRNRGNTWVAGAGLGFLTLNSGLAIYRAKGDLASILFVSGSYITLLLLFGYLHTYEQAPPGSPAWERARRNLWPLTMAFAWRVAAVVWVLAVATTAGGFFALFLLVTVFYVAVVLLFVCLRAYERAPPGSPASERARRAVWALTTQSANRIGNRAVTAPTHSHEGSRRHPPQFKPPPPHTEPTRSVQRLREQTIDQLQFQSI
ncbi:unnamed protein product [Urochloa humidicola]